MLTRLQLPKDTLFLYAGEFGRAVLAELDTHGSTVLPAEEPTYVASLPFARLIITAWPGERFDDRDRVDSVAFFRKIPSCRNRREVSPAITASKIGRTISTECKIYHVSFFEIVT